MLHGPVLGVFCLALSSMFVFCLWLTFLFSVFFFFFFFSSLFLFSLLLFSLLCWPLAVSIHTSAADGPRVHIHFFFLLFVVETDRIEWFVILWVCFGLLFSGLAVGLPGLEKSCYF